MVFLLIKAKATRLTSLRAELISWRNPQLYQFVTDLWTIVLHVYNYWTIGNSFLTVLTVCTPRLTSVKQKRQIKCQANLCVGLNKFQVQQLFWYFTNSKKYANMHPQRVFKCTLLKCAPTSTDYLLWEMKQPLICVVGYLSSIHRAQSLLSTGSAFNALSIARYSYFLAAFFIEMHQVKLEWHIIWELIASMIPPWKTAFSHIQVGGKKNQHSPEGKNLHKKLKVFISCSVAKKTCCFLWHHFHFYIFFLSGKHTQTVWLLCRLNTIPRKSKWIRLLLKCGGGR